MLAADPRVASLAVASRKIVAASRATSSASPFGAAGDPAPWSALRNGSGGALLDLSLAAAGGMSGAGAFRVLAYAEETSVVHATGFTVKVVEPETNSLEKYLKGGPPPPKTKSAEIWIGDQLIALVEAGTTSFSDEFAWLADAAGLGGPDEKGFEGDALTDVRLAKVVLALTAALSSRDGLSGVSHMVSQPYLQTRA